MCSVAPLVVVPSGDTICEQYNITLRNVQEYLDGGLLKLMHEESLMIYKQVKEDGTSQIGLFAAIDIEDCFNNTVRKHENCTSKSDVTLLNGSTSAPKVFSSVLLYSIIFVCGSR
jgi:uncharacterized protein (DUF1015 family)